MESSMSMLHLAGLLTTFILLSTLGEVAESKVVALGTRPSCIHEARESLSDLNYVGAPGGYSRYEVIEHPQDNAVVKDIVASGVKLYNQQVNGLREFEFREAFGELEAYKTSVYRDKYCVQFTVVIVQCLKYGACYIEKRTTCSLSAHKVAYEKEARIDSETLDCTAAA